MANDGLQVTSGSEWRKLREEGELVELPSGFVARLRPVTVQSLLEMGNVPDFLGQVVAQMIKSGQYLPDEQSEQPMETATKFLELNKILLKEIFLNPKVVDEPRASNEISVADISQFDKEWVLMWAHAPQLKLKPFRDESEPVESVSNS